MLSEKLKQLEEVKKIILTPVIEYEERHTEARSCYKNCNRDNVSQLGSHTVEPDYLIETERKEMENNPDNIENNPTGSGRCDKHSPKPITIESVVKQFGEAIAIQNLLIDVCESRRFVLLYLGAQLFALVTIVAQFVFLDLIFLGYFHKLGLELVYNLIGWDFGTIIGLKVSN